MSDPDVVKELDHWIEETLVGEVFRSLLHRTRDEIVALRNELNTVPGWVADRRSKVRNAALEEASQVCEWASDAAPDLATFKALKQCVEAIRALKDKRDAS